MAFLDDFKEKFNKAAQSVSVKTKDSMEISRLTGESKNVSTELESVYSQIGHTYADSKGQAVDALNALCERVVELRARLDDLKMQMLQIKNQNLCPNCGAVIASDSRFCPNCGEKLPEAPEESAGAQAE